MRPNQDNTINTLRANGNSNNPNHLNFANRTNKINLTPTNNVRNISPDSNIYTDFLNHYESAPHNKFATIDDPQENAYMRNYHSGKLDPSTVNIPAGNLVSA